MNREQFKILEGLWDYDLKILLSKEAFCAFMLLKLFSRVTHCSISGETIRAYKKDGDWETVFPVGTTGVVIGGSFFQYTTLPVNLL